MKKITSFGFAKLVSAGTLIISASLLTGSAPAADHDFRTDINPALLYFQAYQQLPQFSEADSRHLFEHPTGGAWPDTPFDDRALALIKQYDSSFKLIRRARFSQARCDWGYDLSDGPEALLGGLAPAKRLAQAARFRAMVALDGNHFDAAREDIAAAYALGRNLSKDRVLISVLVQIAIENILTSIVMENYHRLPADQLDQLVGAFDSAPPRGTIAGTIATEHDSFYAYILRKTKAMIAESGGNDDLFWPRFEAFWNPIATEVDSTVGPEPSAEQIKHVAGGKSAGVIQLLDEMPPLYEEIARIMAAPYSEYKEKAPALWTRISESRNPIITQFFRVFTNVRGKEFSAQVRQEMVRAAAAYKRGGMSALRAVRDPLNGEAFEFTRAQFEGVDRGFRLRSKEPFRDFDEVMIFLEKPGKHFRLDGKNAGTAR